MKDIVKCFQARSLGDLDHDILQHFNNERGFVINASISSGLDNEGLFYLAIVVFRPFVHL